MEEIVEQQTTDKPIGVYVLVDDQGFITDINSDLFIKDFEKWIKIDEGYGDKYAHAQSCYFDSLVDENGKYCHKIK